MPQAILATLLAAGLLTGAIGPVGAQIAPVYHGVLRINPARAILDRSTGTATVNVRNWALLVNPQDSNGIFPDQEPIIIVIDNDQYYLEPGALKPMRRGKAWVYHSKLTASDRGIKSLMVKKQPDGSYLLRFSLVGVDLSRMIFELEGVCLGTAVTVGDDDAYTGIVLSRKNTVTRRIRIPDECPHPPGHHHGG